MRAPVPQLLGLLVLTVAAYLPVLVEGGFIWDDNAYVTQNATLETPGGLGLIWSTPEASPQYYPLSLTTFWLEHRLWGDRPLGYHATNVLLHALSVGVLYLLLRWLSVPGALLAAAIFAVHPVHVESVAWISERKNVLSGLFYLLAAFSCLRYTGVDPRGSGPGDGPRPRRWPWLALGFVLFGAALLSKTVTCTLPGAVLLVVWWKRGRVSAIEVLSFVPFIALGAAMGALTASIEAGHVGADLLDFGLSPLERVYLAGRLGWFYLYKLAIPIGLTFIYPRWSIDQGLWWQALFPLAALALLAVLFALRRRVGRGPLAAALFFGGTLLPALGIVDVFPMRYAWAADHFQYLASLGPITLFAAVAATAARRLGYPRAAAAGGTALVALLAVLSAAQCRMYRDLETLWRTTLARNPDASIAHINLGNILADRGDQEGALEHFRMVIEEVDPPERDPIILARAWLNTGNGLFGTGRIAAALDAYGHACEIYPKYGKAHLGRGLCYHSLRNWDAAILAFRRVLEIHPDPRHPLHQQALQNLRAAEEMKQWEAEGGAYN